MDTTIAVSATTYIMTLLIGEVILLQGQPRRRRFAAGLIVMLAVYPVAVYLEGLLVGVIRAMPIGDMGSLLLQIAHFALLFFATVPLVMLCWEIRLRDAVFFCAAGYSLEHIGYAVTSMVMFALRSCGVTFSEIALKIGMWLVFKAAIMLAVYYFLLRPNLKRNTIDASDLRVCVVSVVNLMICMVLNIAKGYGLGNTLNGFTTDVICATYALFGCFLCLFLQTGYFANRSLKESNVVLDRLLMVEAKKHTLNKETVDLINMKCHDLKYQLRRLEEEPEGSHQAIYEEIRQTFDIYDSLVKTENDVLDSIIMNIYPICIKQHIRFT